MLDALEALGAHRRSIIVIGAHAIYLRVAATDVALAPFTRDSDLAIDPRELAPEPRLDEVMQKVGFRLRSPREPGVWLREDGSEIDLMVPASVGGRGRRAARIPPHGEGIARRTTGLEGVLVDHDVMVVGATCPAEDGRAYEVRVAGPAALLVAKLFKLSDRVRADNATRIDDKDAHDAFRILIGTERTDLVTRYQALVRHELSRRVATTALEYLEHLFAKGRDAVGSTMAGRAEEGIGAPDTVAQQVAILATELIDDLSATSEPPAHSE